MFLTLLIILLLGTATTISYLLWEGNGPAEKTVAQKPHEVPLYPNMTDYVKITFPEMINDSAYIIVGEVLEIGESFVQEAWQDLPADAPEGATVIYPLCTPVTLKVKNGIKGAKNGEKIIFYMDGGVTDKYGIKANSHELEEGTVLLLFLTSDGFNWGGQGEFLVIDDKVILNSGILEYLDSEDIVTVMKLDKLLEKIESMMEKTRD